MSKVWKCPFCGSLPSISIQDDGLGEYETRSCSNRNCFMHRAECDVEDWNTRPIEDALAAENEALKARVAELEKHLPSEYLQTQTGLPRYVTKLEADNARMREALEDIRNNDGHLYSEDAYDFRDIAREALKGGE